MSATPNSIKAQLKSWIARNRGHSDSDVFIEELCIAEKSNRADLVHANGSLLGFEIKSAADTLARWKNQSEAYFLIFDEVWLCCHSKHVESALVTSTANAGILVVDDYEGMAMLRRARRNTSVDAYSLTGLLWRTEIANLCNRHGLKIASKTKIADMRAECSAHIHIDAIRAEVVARLKTRYREAYKSSDSSSDGGSVENPPLSMCSSTAHIC